MATLRFMGIALFEYGEGITIDPFDEDELPSIQCFEVKWLIDVPENVSQHKIVEMHVDGTFTLWDDDGTPTLNHMPVCAIPSWRKAMKLDYPPEYYAAMGE